MPKVTFHHSGGQVTIVEAQKGEALLRIALDNGIPMENACGGNGFCTTCMCEVMNGGDNLESRTDREEAMGVTDDPHRLGCQARVVGDVEIRVIEY
jgi:ferredoxin